MWRRKGWKERGKEEGMKFVIFPVASAINCVVVVVCHTGQVSVGHWLIYEIIASYLSKRK